MIVRLLELDQLSPNKFPPDKSCAWLHMATPCYLDLASGMIHVDDDFELVGWCRNMHSHVMYGREGQIGIMLFNDEADEVWQHYPLFDDADIEAAKFETKRNPFKSWNNE